jgi:hypothetical protein
VNGLKNPKSKANKKVKGIVGYSSTSTAMLDFDDASFKTARYWAFRILRLFRSRKTDKWKPQKRIDLEGFLLVKSSKKHYHIVYNRTVSWIENLNVVAWACLLTHKTELMKYLVMQILKGSSTLRIGKKGDKPAPRIVFRYGKQDSEIKNYLNIRKAFRNV